MRYGLISDVHGNLEALEACLDHLAALGCDRLAFLGDAVGYGASPDAVCTRLRQAVDVAVLGNHDAAVTGRLPASAFYEAARISHLHARAALGPDNLAWLRALPYTARAGPLGFCHGSPAQPEAFDYLLQPAQVEALAAGAATLAPVTFIGHSHLPLAFVLTGETATQLSGPTFACDPAAHTIVTAGSVGQPRDRDPRACCGTFDLATWVFTYHRVPYDVARARSQILAAGLAPLFGDRLLVGM